MIMAGIVDQFIKGAVGSLAKDKITSQLTPTQMELASFILNPQYYMAEKGINKIADILGYGSEYRNLSADAKNDKDLYKEIMRDSIGDVLPSSIGDIVRATPRVEEPYDPYNGYFAQNINDWVSTRTATPEEYNRFENTVRDMNYGTQTPGTGKYVGPLEEDNPIFESNVSNLPYDLKSTPVSGAPDDFDPALLAAIIRDANTTGTGATDDLGEVTIVDQKPSGSGNDLSYTEMIDVLNSTPSISGSRGLNVPGAESLAPVGSVYDASIGANTPITESLAPASYTFDVNTGTVVPATDISSLAPVGSTYDSNLGMNVPVTDTTSLAPTGSNFDPNLGMNVPATESFTPIDFGGTMDYSAVLDNDYGDFGGGGSKGNIEDYSYSQYRYGGQIHRGRR